MSTAAIIAEYNPFHTGHLYQIEKVRELTGAEHIVIIMSGNYVQRGTPAVFDKYTRTHMALSCGCDVIFELPVFYSTGSAEYFAAGAVNLAASLGCIDYLCFGCETENMELIKSISNILINEPEEYTKKLKELLSLGRPFAESRIKALVSMFSHENKTMAEQILSSPNSILAIEYVKAIVKNNYNIKPVIIKRDYSYHSESLNEKFASASGIRMGLKSNQPSDNIKNYIPYNIHNIFDSSVCIYEDDFSECLIYKLLFETNMQQYLDVNEFMENRIKNNIKNIDTYSNLTSAISGKHTTTGRCSRALLHIMLGITSENIRFYMSHGYNHYLRLLGFRKSHSDILNLIKKNSSLPIISKMSDSNRLLNNTALSMLQHNIKCDNLYYFIRSKKYNLIDTINEYTTGMIVHD